MPSPRRLVLALPLVAVLWPLSASAQQAGVAYASAAEELTALEAQLARSATELASGCAVACPALASMEHAADRICALDPGPRCVEARSKVRDAARRVHEACGDCPAAARDGDRGGREEQAASGPRAPAELKQAPRPAPPPPVPQTASEAVLAEAAPRRGGCAGCVVARDDRGALGASVLAAIGVLLRVARRRSKAPRSRHTS